MDLIAGFTEFFECYESAEFDQVWAQPYLMILNHHRMQ
jgi:type VI protein secretion system component VasK